MKGLFERYLGFLLCIPILIAGGYLWEHTGEWAMWATLAACFVVQIGYNYILPWLSERRGPDREQED